MDVVAPRLMRDYFLAFPDERNIKVKKWLASENIWLVRSAIRIHLKMKDETDLPFLFETILAATGTNEFFINKAIGWILRENSKRIPKEIEAFIKEHESKLHPLAIREGMRIILKK